MPKIVIFGGTGMTGQKTVEHALKKGKPLFLKSLVANLLTTMNLTLE